MYPRPLDCLEVRINDLETRLSGATENGDVSTEVARLKSKVKKLYQKTPEYDGLYQLVASLDLWDELREKESNGQTFPLDTPEFETQQQEILVKYPKLIEACNQIRALASIDTSKLINYVDTLQEVPDFEAHSSTIEKSKVEAAKLADQVHLMVVKCLIVIEKHMALLIRENEYWSTTGERLKVAAQKMHALERQYESQHKY